MSSPALAAEPDGRAATTSQSQKLLKLRARLENAIEKAIALLDELDGDPDLEPSLGYQPWVHAQGWGAQYLDLELDESG